MSIRKRVEITQEICLHAQRLIKGGATNKEAARLIGTISETTVRRIRQANYDSVKYQQLLEARMDRERGTAALYRGRDKSTAPDPEREKQPDRMEDLQAAGDQVPEQMAMDLQPEDDGAKEMAEYLHCEDAPAKKVDIVSFMRLYAGKTENLITWISEACKLLHRNMEKLDKINDNLCQILRRMDK